MMRDISFQLNGADVLVGVRPHQRLLDVLRRTLDMTGTKEGCGEGECGACTVLVDGRVVNACLYPAYEIEGRSVTTIEGLASDHPVQEAWIEENVPQCGYCQPGQVMSAAYLLERHPNPSDAEIDEVMSGNICRCGTYPRIRRAIATAAMKTRDIAASQGAAPRFVERKNGA